MGVPRVLPLLQGRVVVNIHAVIIALALWTAGAVVFGLILAGVIDLAKKKGE